MKSVLATLGLAAMANAYSYPRHMHYRRGNSTDTGATTLTVFTTQVHTITSCAPTVTNCPARQTDIDQLPETDKTTAVVTETVVLTETVCPVSEAGSISSSVIEKAQTGGITAQYTLTTPISTTAAPLSTGYGDAPVTDSDNSGETQSLTTITSAYVTDKTLTLTIGTGAYASVTTTTVHSTIQTTITVPCSQVTGEDTGNVTKDNSGNGNTEEPTTTTTGTKTATITLTISEADTTETKTAGENSGESHDQSEDTGSESSPSATGANSGSEGTCECNGATATVTVTAPASTVYVTVGNDEATKTATYGSTETGSDNGSDNSGSDDNGSDDDDDEDDYCDDEDITTTVQATVTVVPYPVNSTMTSGYAGPTGFARLVR